MNPTSLVFPQKGHFSEICNVDTLPKFLHDQNAKPHKFNWGEPVSPSQEPPRCWLGLLTPRSILEILTQ